MRKSRMRIRKRIKIRSRSKIRIGNRQKLVYPALNPNLDLNLIPNLALAPAPDLVRVALAGP
jgi:hypothetical protein